VRTLALFLTAIGLSAQTPSGFPFYSSDSVANAASARRGPLAPGSLVTIYGKYLSVHTGYFLGPTTRTLTASRGDGYPMVWVASEAVPLLFASPGQVNVILPGRLRTGVYKLRLSVNSRSGPEVDIDVRAEAPELFAADELVIGTQADGSVLSESNLPPPGGIITLYGTGCGRVVPDLSEGQVPADARRALRGPEMRVWLNGDMLAAESILYVGTSPGLPGVCQLNVRLPETLPPNPELRLGFEEPLSRSGLRLTTRKKEE
jgi:uncharacterized protein (TIGR03437 family)